MSYFTDATDLISVSHTTFQEIEQAYKESLQDKVVKPALLIKIKNFMENLRSALDYTAHGLFDKYGGPARIGALIYFPYARDGLSQTDFSARNIINQKIPGLPINRPDIAAKIESYQHFSSPDNAWLPKFMDLNNENKHQQLTPQTSRETKELRITSGNVGLKLGEGATIKLGGNATLRIGEAIVRGNQHLSASSPARFDGIGKQEIIHWVSFHFANNNENVLVLLKKALDGAETIVAELSAM